MQNLRPFKASDFQITNTDVINALRAALTPALPNAYGIYGDFNLACAFCQDLVEDIGTHRCNAVIACATCGDVHPIQNRWCV